MKKKVLFIVSAIALAISVSAFVYVKNENNSIKQLFDANVEALAENEGNNTNTCESCYNGGIGAKECSIDAGIDIGVGVSASCSVACQDGYYACCSLRCICCSI